MAIPTPQPRPSATAFSPSMAVGAAVGTGNGRVDSFTGRVRAHPSINALARRRAEARIVARAVVGPASRVQFDRWDGGKGVRLNGTVLKDRSNME